MTPEEHRMLVETYQLAQENAEALRGIRKANRLSVIFRVLYWVFIIGASLGAFYLIQPYIDAMKDAYSSLLF